MNVPLGMGKYAPQLIFVDAAVPLLIGKQNSIQRYAAKTVPPPWDSG